MKIGQIVKVINPNINVHNYEKFVDCLGEIVAIINKNHGNEWCYVRIEEDTWPRVSY